MLAGSYHAPSVALSDIVEVYYYFAAPLPPGLYVDDRLLCERANIRIMLEGESSVVCRAGTRHDKGPAASAFGHNSYPIDVHLAGAFRIFGIGVSTFGWPALFDLPLGQLTDNVVPLAELIGDDAGALTARLLACPDDRAMAKAADEYLLIRARQRDYKVPPREVQALEIFIQNHSINRVEDMAAHIGLGVRALERLTSSSFGLSPKMLLRRQRFVRTVRAMRKPSPVALADQLAEDYFDQSHMIKEFRRFAGETPAELLARPAPFMDIAFVVQTHLRRADTPDGLVITADLGT